MLYEDVVAAGALYNQRVLEEVCDRLGPATESRTPTPGLQPVIEIAGVPPETAAAANCLQAIARHKPVPRAAQAVVATSRTPSSTTTSTCPCRPTASRSG
ncbi:hypothetical protein SCOCK_690020 [Actinacidiphila cocklensis]|uniref:Uncharacterized protein n=2 Tax=Actinacidiphila cocklensis TaxID=887465 RepID=A0A9W4DYP5_9ACTN|nr:hypothetical protein SCOCK_690020 [Actinacidiphila cocklensis]